MRGTITVTLLLFAGLLTAAAGPATKSSTKPTTRPAAEYAGEEPPAKRIVFVSNGSKSMAKKMASLRLQLASAVGGLTPDQQFNIVFWQDGKAVAFQKDRLVAAGEADRREAFRFLDGVEARGTGEAVPAITFAFAQKPDLIYFLTDGDFPDNDAVLKKFRALNAGRKVKVIAIAFVNDQDTDTKYITLLETVARESHRGLFKKVAENELDEK